MCQDTTAIIPDKGLIVEKKIYKYTNVSFIGIGKQNRQNKIPKQKSTIGTVLAKR